MVLMLRMAWIEILLPARRRVRQFSAPDWLTETAFALARRRYQRFSSVTWMRLPQVSFSMAILEAVTSVGGMVNSAPLAFMRS